MRSPTFSLLICAVLLAGCGGGDGSTTRGAGPGAPARPSGFVTYRYPGFSVALPTNWDRSRGATPLLVAAQSGEATTSVWRYVHSQPLPRTHASLQRALRALLAQTRRLHPDFALDHARVAPVAHHGGISLVGTETLGGRRVQVRSTHVFTRGAEIVVDSYVGPELFPVTDQQAFLPVVYRLRISRRT